MAQTQENSNSWKWLKATHLKYHVEQKTKEGVGVGAVTGGDQEKPVNQGKVVVQI